VKTGPDSSFAESVWYVVGVLVISRAGIPTAAENQYGEYKQ
jgi:hypothetical protein